MKINKNFGIPIILTIIVCILAVVISKMPILPALTPIVALGVIFLVKEKLHFNYILAIIFGSISVFLYIGILVVVGLLSKQIVMFPY